jgi:hypothetical protein
MFPLIMTSSALIFFSPSWPRRLIKRLGPQAGQDVVPRSKLDRRIAIVIALHVLLQIALPLRHHLYPGPVLWNEDGMRFAWHVMIREKHGSVMFVAKFPGGKQLEVPPSNYLTWRQEREMGAQPDLILQLARRIGEDLETKGYRDFTLHAITKVSLNGRPPIAMIDPTVNLLAIRDLGPRSWVTDPPDRAPPHVQPLR